MYRKVVTKLSDFGTDASDDIIVLPQNKTLYVDQFTDEAPHEDEERAAFMARSMKDVFEYYQPTKNDIALKTVEGELVYEDFRFYSIEDFEDNQLINQSELLGQQKKSSQAQEAFRKNLFHIHEQVKDLEIAYRTIDSFFANAGQGDMECLTLMNVNKKKLKQNDSVDTLAVKEELENHYDKLSLHTNYSLLVMPGYLGDADNVRKWAKIAYDNKVLMVTDFQDCVDFNDLKKRIKEAELQGEEKELGKVIMTCNYILGRNKSELAGEDLFIPGSAALAGRLTDTETINILETVAGRKGILRNVKGTRIDLRKAEIASLIDLGMIPMVDVDGCIMAFSNRSLYNGILSFLQVYPTVRVLDWISKLLQHIINHHVFEFWNVSLKNYLIETIINCLDDYKGATQPIEYYRIKNLDQDPTTKDISLVVDLKIYSCTRPIVLELKAHDNSLEGPVWEEVIQI